MENENFLDKKTTKGIFPTFFDPHEKNELLKYKKLVETLYKENEMLRAEIGVYRGYFKKLELST